MAKQVAKQRIAGAVTGGARRFESKVFKGRWSRGGEWFEAQEYAVRLASGGRRETVNLGTTDVREAAKRAARFAAVLKSNGWEAAFADLSPEAERRVIRRDVPTVGEVISAAEQRAVNVKPATLRAYANSLRQLAGMVAGIEGDESRFNYRPGGGLHAWRAKVDGVSLADLTDRAINAAGAVYVKGKGGTDAAKRTLAAVLRMARGFWSKRLLPVLPFEAMPNPWPKVIVESPRPPRYLPTFDSAELVAKARAELRDTRPELWKGFLLTLGAGLRKSEADRLQWSHVDFAKLTVRVVQEGKSFESMAEVPIAEDTALELERLKKDASGLFVLEGAPRPTKQPKRQFYGAARTWGCLTEWLRANGVNSLTPTHTLRKEAGSLINAAAGIHAASRFLRHASLHVTSQHYADARTRVVVGLFGAEAEKEGVGQ